MTKTIFLYSSRTRYPAIIENIFCFRVFFFLARWERKTKQNIFRAHTFEARKRRIHIGNGRIQKKRKKVKDKKVTSCCCSDDLIHLCGNSPRWCFAVGCDALRKRRPLGKRPEWLGYDQRTLFIERAFRVKYTYYHRHAFLSYAYNN